MPMTAVVVNISKNQNRIIVDGTVTLTGNYATNGVTLDLSKLGIPSSGKPTSIWFWSTVNQGAGMLLDAYSYVPGADQSNGKLQIGVAGAEEAAAAFAATSPTNAAGYVLHFQAEFAAFI